ncbi:MAG: transposase [Xenococcaceae cyanobacterium MO_167.B27]|nr:transposase [Xenococcaceae cyanobacterium MO_167.B27]
MTREIKLLQRKLRNKKKGSKNRAKINHKIARLHQRITDTRKDFHFKTAHKLVEGAGMIFVEDINFKTWSRGMLRKQFADAGFGNFVNILQWVCKKTDTYFAKVDKDYTSQICPRCDTYTGKKSLDVRIHYCDNCGYTNNRDVVASEVILKRGLGAVGLTSEAVAFGTVSLDKMSVVGDLTGTSGNSSLVKSRRSRKPKS